jgi:hypothetical protein
MALVMALAGGFVLLAPAQAVTTADTPVAPHILPPLAETDLPPVETGTGCGRAAPTSVPDGKPIVVSVPPGPTFTVGRIPAGWWRKPPYGDPTWQLQLRGMIWVRPLAERAYRDGQKQALKVLVDQVLAFHRQDPDPGTRTAAATRNANAWGWDEGTAARRLESEDCLYTVTRDARLAPAIAQDVNVQYGPRFYGPPGHPVHNHGVWADLAIIRAGDLLGRKDWNSRSIARLVRNAPGAWTPAGTTIEQSSLYHLFNLSVWRDVAAVLGKQRVAAASVRRVKGLVDKADRVAAWLTEPDRHLVVLGDGTAASGVTRSRWTTHTFRDDRAGLIVGRWSWIDAGTVYYTVRYGPPRTAHGQQERAGITWSAGGRRVLVGPGTGTYDRAGNYKAWTSGAPSHNVATVDGRQLTTRPSVSLTASTVRAPAHAWATQDQLFGVRHLRQYTVVHDGRRLVVKDTYAARTSFHQFWHLDPSWVLRHAARDGRSLRFVSGSRTLAVTTTGVARVVRGSTRPVAGWNFPGGGKRVAADEIQVRASGTAATTFVLS